jgi:hypothetical protein
MLHLALCHVWWWAVILTSKVVACKIALSFVIPCAKGDWTLA